LSQNGCTNIISQSITHAVEKKEPLVLWGLRGITAELYIYSIYGKLRARLLQLFLKIIFIAYHILAIIFLKKNF
jgi:hypothetical protein